MGGSAAETIRQPRDRSKGQPQEREQCDLSLTRTVASYPLWQYQREWVTGHAGPTASGEGRRIFLREGSSPEGPRPGIPTLPGSPGLGERSEQSLTGIAGRAT